MQGQESKQRMTQLVSAIAYQINCSVLESSFEAICKIYKQISTRVCYFMNYLKLARPQYDQLSQSILTCMNALKILVQSTEYRKYSHCFPIFQKLLRNYELMLSAQLQPVQMQKVISMTQKNQKSHIYLMFTNDAIQLSEIKFLKSERVSAFFSDVSSQEIILQDPQCVCCSRVFIKNLKIFNNNPLISVMAQLTQKKGFDQIIFETYVSAVCNKRGGIILIGIDKKEQDLIATGIKFNTVAQIEKRQSEIRMAIMRAKPICRHQIQRVLVHTNYVNPTKIGQEYMRICFRISIFPYQPSKINYSQISNKGYHRIYQVFKFDHEKKPYRIVSTPETPTTQFQSLYTMMHQKYRQNNSIVNSHQNIKCFTPHPHYSKLFHKYVEQGCPPEVEEIEQVCKVQCQVQECNEDEPKFKYQNVSLLIVGSKKGERFILDFEKALNKKKQKFELSQPFAKSFREGVRQIWMVSHQIHFLELRNYQKGLEVKSGLKQSSLIMMPVYKTLQIERSKFYQNKQHIENKYKTRYGQLLRIQAGETLDGNKKPKSVIYLHFNSFNKAIFAYLIFEQLQLKPYFTKDGNNDCAY